MIYIAENPLHIHLDSALAAVSEQRRRHALRYRSDNDRRLSVAAYLLLCHALKEEFGITAPPEFAFTEHGKPYLPLYPHILFSISHCHEAVACAVAASPVGIDVESLSAFDPALIAAVMSPAEQERILCAASPALEFTRRWTMKESLLKMRGDGLTTTDHLATLFTSTTSEVDTGIGDIASSAAGHRFITHENPTAGYVCTSCLATDAHTSPAEVPIIVPVTLLTRHSL